MRDPFRYLRCAMRLALVACAVLSPACGGHASTNTSSFDVVDVVDVVDDDVDSVVSLSRDRTESDQPGSENDCSCGKAEFSILLNSSDSSSPQVFDQPATWKPSNPDISCPKAPLFTWNECTGDFVVSACSESGECVTVGGENFSSNVFVEIYDGETETVSAVQFPPTNALVHFTENDGVVSGDFTFPLASERTISGSFSTCTRTERPACQ